MFIIIIIVSILLSKHIYLPKTEFTSRLCRWQCSSFEHNQSMVKSRKSLSRARTRASEWERGGSHNIKIINSPSTRFTGRRAIPNEMDRKGERERGKSMVERSWKILCSVIDGIRKYLQVRTRFIWTSGSPPGMGLCYVRVCVNNQYGHLPLFDHYYYTLDEMYRNYIFDKVILGAGERLGATFNVNTIGLLCWNGLCWLAGWLCAGISGVYSQKKRSQRFLLFSLHWIVVNYFLWITHDSRLYLYLYVFLCVYDN